MQAFSPWSPPVGTLGRIVGATRARIAALEARRAELEREAEEALPGASLERALRGPTVALIAEFKRRSPSKGAIGESLEALAQAEAYAEGGAAAVSILTEPDYFGGSSADLRHVRAGLALPILKKDFHLAPVQLLEARALGASAALLIARALAPDRLEALAAYGRAIGLELLIEIRDEDELRRALAAGATMIGVNNRNLESLEIDPMTAERIIPLVPASVIAIAESGVRDRGDVERYAVHGADAVLVGSVLSASVDPLQATSALTGALRRRRDG